MGWFDEHGWHTYIGNRPDGWTPSTYTITRKDVGRIDPKLLVDLPGGNGEHLYFRHNDGQFESVKYPGQEWLDMVGWAKEELAKPDTNHVVMIVKDKNHRVYIHEGNHRIRAAVQAGLPDIPVEFVYWACSEDSGLIYNPETKQFSPHGLIPAPKLASTPTVPLKEPPVSMCASARLFHRVAGPDIDALVTEFLGFLDPKGQLPRPTIKIQNNAASRWLGQCGPEGLFNEQHVCVSVKATIYLQKILLDAPEDLRRVVAHEIAHYYAFAASVLGKHLQDYNEIVTQDNKEGGHGAVWQAVIQKVNATYGENFITVTSDQTYTFKAKEVNLFIMRQDNRLDWCWSTQMPERVVDFMAQMNRIGSGIACFIGKTDNKFLVVKEAKATNTAMPWCSPWAQEQVDALEAAWASQTNHFADYASGVAKGVTKQRAKTWTLVMANPYREDSPRYSAHPTHLAGWKLGRTLTEREKDIISQLNAIGMDTRFTRINNDDALFNTLPQVDMNDVIHNRGLVAGKLMEPEVQERLLAAWPRGERPVKQKTASQGKLFLDMDGVLADYSKGAAMAGLTPEDFKDQPGAFRNLELLPGARHAVTQLLQTWGPGRVYILSTPPHGRCEEAEQEKREWLQEHFPDINPSNVILTLNKAKHGTIHDILVDDHPTWNGAAEFPGKVVAFTGPEAWNEVLGLKTASFWGADDTKFHRRQDDAQLRTVQQGLRERFNQLLNGLYVQPQGRNMTLRQFLAHNPVMELFRSTDKSVRLMGNKLRADLDAFLHQNYTPAQIQQFKDTFGANVTDWIHRKIVAKQATLFVRLAVSDDVLRQRYGVSDEQLELAKAVDRGPYLEWVVKQMVGVKPKRPDLSYEEANTKTPTVKLPEDTEKLKTLLTTFTKLKRSPKFTGSKDINAYLPKDLFQLHDAAQAPEGQVQLSQREQRTIRRDEAVIWAGNVEGHAIEVLQPKTVEAVMEIGGGPGVTLEGRPTNSTSWCTTQEEHASRYVNQGPIYIFKQDGRNLAQFHPYSQQFMDVEDVEVPTLDADGQAYVTNPELAAGMIGAKLDGEGGFHAFNRETAPPVVLAHVFGQEGDDLDDDVAAKIESDPVALGVLLGRYDYEPQDSDEAILLSTPAGALSYVHSRLLRYYKATVAGQGIGELFTKAVATLAADPETTLKFLDFLHTRSTGTLDCFHGNPMPQWFTPVFKAMWDNPVIGWRGVKIIPQEQRDQLMPHLVEVDPDEAIDYASKSRRGAKWPELEAAILKRGDQSLALKYVHYVVTIPGDDRIRDLVWSKLPEDDNDLWTMGAYVSNLMDWAVRNLYKDHPIPYEQSQKFLPEVAEKAVWESNNPNLLAAYAAKCYQDVPGKLEAALRRIVELGQGTAAIAYVEKAKYARTEILEPLLLDVLVRQGSYLGHDVALYVAHNYNEKVQGARDAGQILIRELESRGVEVPAEAYRSLGIKPRVPEGVR